MTTQERLIAAPTPTALDCIVAHALRWRLPARRWRHGDALLAGVVGTADEAWVCREVVADESAAPARFEVAP